MHMLANHTLHCYKFNGRGGGRHKWDAGVCQAQSTLHAYRGPERAMCSNIPVGFRFVEFFYGYAEQQVL